MNTNDRLLQAVKEKRLDLVNEYLKYCSLSTIDWAGNTALHLASSNGDIEIAKCLIRSGANVNMCNKFKKTPLHLTCQSGHELIANLLLEHGSDINAKDMLQMTPIFWCVERNYDNLVILLCGRDNLNLNAIDKFNRTCFDICLKNSNDFIHKVLTNARDSLNNKINELENVIISGISELEMLIDDSNSSMDTTVFENEPKTSAFTKIVKPRINYDTLLDTDDDDDDELASINGSKKTRFSFSPIQNAEETLFWLKKQAMSNSTDYLLDENCELSLTEAGKLTLDYLNKNDPIGDEQRLLIRLAKKIEDEGKELSQISAETDDNFGENLDDWFIDNINFDSDKNEFF